MKCENCGNENIEILNARKGHYLCGKCGRDTEALYEIAIYKEIRAMAIEEFAEAIKYEFGSDDIHETVDEIANELKKKSNEVKGE